MDLFSLIRTKMAPPRIGGGLVHRHKLMAHLEEHQRCVISLILGPGGSGKTTLAAIWRKNLIAKGVDVAWYNIGADDDDGQCSAYLVACLQQAGLEIDDLMAQTLLREAAESNQRFINYIVNKLFAHPRQIFIFFEDYYLLRGRHIKEVVQSLLDNSPPQLHIVITSRLMPALRLELLQRKGLVQEINFSELRFSVEEQTAFLVSQGIKTLNNHQALKLHALTEGWAAGLQLVAWSMKKDIDFEETYSKLTKRAHPLAHEEMVGYFKDTISSILEPYQIDLLVRMSACRRLTRELADTICQDSRSGDLLVTLGSQCFFLLPIESDDPNLWFRFHRIFATFLRDRLVDLDADELIKINSRASEWFEKKNLYVEAIRHAGYAGDTPRRINLLSIAARKLICNGQFIQLLRWSSEMPEEALQEKIQLMLCIGWSQLCSRNLGDFEKTLAVIQRHPDATLEGVDFEVRLLRALHQVARDDTEQTLSLIEPFLEKPPQTDGFNLVMLGICAANSLINKNEFRRAQDLVTKFQILLRQKYGSRTRPYLDSLFGLSLLLQGDFVQARDKLEQLKCAIEAEGGGAEFSVAHIAGYLAEAAWHLGDIDAAEEYHEIYTEMADLLGSRSCTLYGLLTRARLHFDQGDMPRALQSLDELEYVAQDEGWDRLAAWSLAERVRMLGKRAVSITTMRESLRRLNRLASRYTSNAFGAHSEIPLAASIAEVDAAAAEFDWTRVIELGLPLSAQLADQGRMYLAARMRLLAAIAYHRENKSDTALQVLRPIITLAAYYGMRRLFIDEGESAEELVRSLLSLKDLTTIELAFLQGDKLSTLDIREPQKYVAEVANDVDGNSKDLLSPKEIEILILLSRALSGKTIARALNVSPGTIKWHRRNIYGKLGAVSREDALTKARALKLLA